jgi:hypothetical protein
MQSRCRDQDVPIRRGTKPEIDQTWAAICDDLEEPNEQAVRLYILAIRQLTIRLFKG